MLKLNFEGDKKNYWIPNSWRCITFEKFMSLGPIVGNAIADNIWFADYITNKYKGIEGLAVDFDTLVGTDKLPVFNKIIRELIKPLADCKPENFDTISNLSANEIFCNIEPFYSSLLLQAIVGWTPGERMKAIKFDGTFKMLNTGVQIFGNDWKQKAMTAKGQTEINDLIYLFNEKLEHINPIIDNIDLCAKGGKGVFEHFPLLAAVLITPIYNEDEVFEKAEKLKQATMQELFDVFFYVNKLVLKYKKDIPKSMEVKITEIPDENQKNVLSVI